MPKIIVSRGPLRAPVALQTHRPLATFSSCCTPSVVSARSSQGATSKPWSPGYATFTILTVMLLPVWILPAAVLYGGLRLVRKIFPAKSQEPTPVAMPQMKRPWPTTQILENEKLDKIREYYWVRQMPTTYLDDLFGALSKDGIMRRRVIADLPFGLMHCAEQSAPREERAQLLQAKRRELDHLIEGEEPIKEALLDHWVLYQSGKTPPILSLCGAAGSGKSTILGAGMTALYEGRPHYVVPLGGAGSAGRIVGQDPTYKEAAAGVIVAALRTTQVMNPIIIFDELDHTSSEHDGKTYPVLEAISNLIESTPPTATGERWFVDHYLGEEIKIDISKIAFAFTFNRLDKIRKQANQLVSRLGTILETSPITDARRQAISKKIFEQHNPGGSFTMDDDVLNHLACVAKTKHLSPRLIREGIKSLMAMANRRAWSAASADADESITITREDVDTWSARIPAALSDLDDAPAIAPAQLHHLAGLLKPKNHSWWSRLRR